MVIIVVGRLAAVVVVWYLFRICFHKETISFPELMFITYGGMIRGAIAFALVLQIPYDCPDGDECLDAKYFELLKSTCLAVVMLTTLIFGSFMKVV